MNQGKACSTFALKEFEMADTQVDVKFGGDAGEAQKAIADVSKALKDGVSEMNQHVGTIADTFSKFSGMLAGFTAVLAGGALFKAAISETLAFTGEISALSKKMGITSDEAVTLSLSLKLVGATTESYTGAASMLDRQLRSNEAGLKQMGVVTRDANGDFQKQPEIMKSAFDALMQYKEGTDRNLASQAMFGRGADEIAKLMKVNGSITEEATRLQKAWNIEVGDQGIKDAKEYKMAMAETGIAMDAISDALGKTVLPLSGTDRRDCAGLRNAFMISHGSWRGRWTASGPNRFSILCAFGPKPRRESTSATLAMAPSASASMRPRRKRLSTI